MLAKTPWCLFGFARVLAGVDHYSRPGLECAKRPIHDQREKHTVALLWRGFLLHLSVPNSVLLLRFRHSPFLNFNVESSKRRKKIMEEDRVFLFATSFKQFLSTMEIFSMPLWIIIDIQCKSVRANWLLR